MEFLSKEDKVVKPRIEFSPARVLEVNKRPNLYGGVNGRASGVDHRGA